MRGFIALLLVLNLATLAWQWELFAPWGWAPRSAREPERVLNQIRPEVIRVETPAATAKRMADEAAQAETAQAETSAPDAAPTPKPEAATGSTAKAAVTRPAATSASPSVGPSVSPAASATTVTPKTGPPTAQPIKTTSP